MPRKITTEALRKRLLAFIDTQGSQVQAAVVIGVGQAFMNAVVRRKRPLGTKIPSKLGYKPVLMYEELEEKQV